MANCADSGNMYNNVLPPFIIVKQSIIWTKNSINYNDKTNMFQIMLIHKWETNGFELAPLYTPVPMPQSCMKSDSNGIVKMTQN